MLHTLDIRKFLYHNKCNCRIFSSSPVNYVEYGICIFAFIGVVTFMCDVRAAFL